MRFLIIVFENNIVIDEILCCVSLSYRYLWLQKADTQKKKIPVHEIFPSSLNNAWNII